MKHTWVVVSLVCGMVSACNQRDYEAEQKTKEDKRRAAIASSEVLVAMEELAATPLPEAEGDVSSAVPFTDGNTLLAVPDASALAAVRAGTGSYPAAWLDVPYYLYRLREVDGPLESLQAIRYVGFVKTIERIDPRGTSSEAFEPGLLRGEVHFFELATRTYLGGVAFGARSSESVLVTDGKRGELAQNLTDNARWALHDAIVAAVPGSTIGRPNRTDRDADAIIKSTRRTRAGEVSFHLLPTWRATRDPRLSVLLSAEDLSGPARRVITVWEEDRVFDYGSEARCKEITGQRVTETDAKRSRTKVVHLAGHDVCTHVTVGATSFDVWAIFPSRNSSVFARCSGAVTDTIGSNACEKMLSSWRPEQQRTTRVTRKGVSIAAPAGWHDRPLGGNQIMSGTWSAGGSSAELMVRPLGRPITIDTRDACKNASIDESENYQGSKPIAELFGEHCIITFYRQKRVSMVGLFASSGRTTHHAFCDAATLEDLVTCRDILRSWRFE